MSCGYRGLKDIPRMFLELRDAADAVWITVRSSSKCIERMPRWINGDISEQKTPTPERVPRRPWAKLNRPVPFARSAMTSVVSTPSVAPLRPSSIWMTTSNAGAAVNAKKCSANPYDTDSDEQKWSTPPGVGSASYPRRQQPHNDLWATINADMTSEDQRRSACTNISPIRQD